MNDPCGKTMHRRTADIFNVFQCCRIKWVKCIVKIRWLYLTLCSFLLLIVFIFLLWLFCLLASSWTIATLLTYTVTKQPHTKWVDCKVYNAQWSTTRINLKTHTYNTILVNDQLDTQFFFLICLLQFSTCLSNTILIIRRINCINTSIGIRHSM
jgi:hypothetical protein